MKKVLVLAVVAAAAVLIWKKIEMDREERELWAEVTDPVS
jgi:uncharacterized protein YxeA